MSRIPLALCLSDGLHARALGIGLLGCGTVGGGVARALLGEASPLRRGEHPAALRRIGVRDVRKSRPGVAWQRYDDDLFAVVDDPDVHVVVECIGGVGLARELVTRAIARGKHVVTANKDLIATEGPWLAAFAARTGGSLRFEAAVGGAIPIVRALSESLAGEDVVEVGGVLNGTTNFVLDAMERGASYAEALADAQRLGYAEADPSADVDGHDAAHKLAILARLAFRRPLTSPSLARSGIRGLDAADVAFAAACDARIKLVAIARRVEGGVAAGVAPALVHRSHAFAGPSGPQNCVRVVGRGSGALTFAGAGAGGDATASAIVGDVLAALRLAAHATRGEAPAPLADDPTRALRLPHVVRLPSRAAAAAALDAAHALGHNARPGPHPTAIAVAALDPAAAAAFAGELAGRGVAARALPWWEDAA